MPITVTCEDCTTSHRVKDEAVGKRLKCTGCGKVLTVVAPESDHGDYDLQDIDVSAEASLAHSEEQEVPTRKRPKTQSTSKSSGSGCLSQTKVLTGVNLVFFGFVMVAALMIIIAVQSLFGSRALIGVMPLLSGLGLLASVLTMVGKLLCLTVPAQVKGKEFLYVAASIDVIAMLMVGVRLVTRVPAIVSMLQTPLTVVGFLTFVLFIRRLGEYLNEADVVDRADGVLRLGYMLVAAWVLTNGLMLFGGRLGLGAAMGLSLVMLILGLLSAVRYGGLLNSARYAVLEAD